MNLLVNFSVFGGISPACNLSIRYIEDMDKDDDLMLIVDMQIFEPLLFLSILKEPNNRFTVFFIVFEARQYELFYLFRIFFKQRIEHFRRKHHREEADVVIAPIRNKIFDVTQIGTPQLFIFYPAIDGGRVFYLCK